VHWFPSPHLLKMSFDCNIDSFFKMHFPDQIIIKKNYHYDLKINLILYSYKKKVFIFH
jgi:hypothetical protein